MRNAFFQGAAAFVICAIVTAAAGADQRGSIYALGLELERLASAMAQESFGHFRGRNDTISDEEQAVLFNSEAFLSSCRLFLRLTEERSDYYSAGFLRTNLYNAFLFLARSFRDLEASMRRAGVLPYALSGCRRLLNRMEAEFAGWPAPDNLAYLDQKYVKARNAAVYLIEKRAPACLFGGPSTTWKASIATITTAIEARTRGNSWWRWLRRRCSKWKRGRSST